MDEALIKPQRVRRVVKIQPPAAGEADVTAQGTLVEVADPRALRPKDFRTDFVYRPQSTAEDLALCELPPLLESVLGGTDALLLVGGPADAGQAELLDGVAGLNARAVGQLAVELQARQARHRSSGSGGYSFYVKLQAFQVLGDRIEDLLTDQPEATRLSDTPSGVVVEGLRSVSVSVAEEAVRTLEMARRRQDPAHRGRAATAIVVDVTQADYFAGWGLFGRLTIVEMPALDCLAEDRGLVQLREGFDTFRGVYHLRSLAHAWQPRQPGDVNGSALTWLTRDALSGGSVAVTVLLCLKQGQPSVSQALLEFLEDFAKVETNPVCCDHRVAGLMRSMRAETLLLRQHVQGGGGASMLGTGGGGVGGGLLPGRETGEDARRIILELEKRLQAAERGRDDAVRNEEMKQGRAIDFQDRYAAAIQGQELMHDRLVSSEEEHLRACEGLVEAQQAHAEVKDEMGELQYKDNLMLLVLEQEVADIQAAEKQRHALAEELQATLEEEEEACRKLQGHIGELRMDAESRDLSASRREESAEGQAAELLGERRRLQEMQIKIDGLTEAKTSCEIELGNVENRLEGLKVELQRGALDATRLRDEDRERGLSELRDVQARAQGPRQELQELRRAVSELREEVSLEAAAERGAREAGGEARAELARLRGDFHSALAGLAAGEAPPPPASGGEASGGGAGAGSGVGLDGGALARLEVLAREGREREQGLLEEQDRLQAHVRELQQRLVWSSHVALDWAPPEGSEREKAKLQDAVGEARAQATAASEAGTRREKDMRQRGDALRAELEAERQALALARAEHAREQGRLQAEAKRFEAEVLELRHAPPAAAAGAPAGGALPPVASIQQQLLSEVELLRGGGAGGDVRHLEQQNQALRAQVERLERQQPREHRVQSQRLAFLERSARSLEAERSELLVRATVAEEQLGQLQKHLKEMTEGYQMQIVQLKLQAKSQ